MKTDTSRSKAARGRESTDNEDPLRDEVLAAILELAPDLDVEELEPEIDLEADSDSFQARGCERGPGAITGGCAAAWSRSRATPSTAQALPSWAARKRRTSRRATLTLRAVTRSSTESPASG